MSVLIAGISGGTHVGHAFFRVAKSLELFPQFFDCTLAYESPKWLKRFNWHLRGKYPSKIASFSESVIQACRSTSPELILTTGIAPVSSEALAQLGDMGIQRFNFLTDDPWNRAHYAPWFLRALPHYDVVFSPRHAINSDLLKIGCHQVQYLPFGYDPDLFYPEPVSPKLDDSVPDVVFAGGGDRHRVPYMQALIQAGIKVELYGAYWDKYVETKSSSRGQADLQTLRRALNHAKVALCLVRRANRDGHCMRTFEVPAVGSCMLTEDTAEHRDIFGEEGEAVVYFSSVEEMVQKAQWLLSHDAERQRLAKLAHQLVTKGKNTYHDRLESILSYARL